MKKIVFITLFAIAAMATVSCSSLEVNNDVAELRVPAVINAIAGAGTKATIDGLQISWVAGDQISLFDDAGTAEGAFTADASGPSVSFSGTKGAGDVLKYAIYPAYDKANCTAGVFTTRIPGEQDGTISNAIAVAEEASGLFVFHNAASVIKITIPASLTDINFVSFLADNAATIAGDVTVSMSDLTAVASSIPCDSDEGLVKYSRVSAYNGGQALSGDIYLTVIPGEYSGTVVFGKKDNNNVRYAATVKVAAKNYVVNRIKNFGTVANLDWIKGAVPGVFSLNASGKRALMSQGYIRYDVDNSTWSIANTFIRLISKDGESAVIDGVLEVFRWNNADTPTGANGHVSEGWVGRGDWAAKLDRSGWSIGTWSDYEFCFRNPNVAASDSRDNRERRRLVSKCVSTVKVAAGEYYTILYPDFWAGRVVYFSPGESLTTMTYDELKEMEDKGCAIFGHGGTLNNKGKWTLTDDPQMNIWTTVFESASKVYSFRSINSSGWTREPKGVSPAYGYCARPFYQVD